ncbi:MAG: hypothetical protein KJP02_05780, partial [Octadecabacter sp.]|nr:hypothetical protein [Octadecabacter sp.]
VQGLTRGLLAGVAAAGALAGAATRLVDETSRYGDELAKTADRLGVNVDALEQLRFAAERSGVETRTLEMAMQRMTRRLSEAAMGAGEARGAIEELGLDAEALGNMAPEDQLLALSDALAGVENQSDRVRLAFRFFDSEGVSLVNMLGEGSEEVRALMQEFERLSGGLTEEQTRASEDFRDRILDLQVAMQGLRLQIGARLMPAMRPLLTTFTEFIEANREIIAQRIADFFEGAANAAENFMEIGRRLLGVGQELLTWFNDLDPAMQAVVGALLLFLGPFGKLRGLILAGGFLAALEDIGAWMRGQTSWIGALLGPYEDFAAKVNEVVEALGGWEVVVAALVALKFAPWLFAVARGARALGVAVGLLGGGAAAGGAAAGGVGLLSRLAGLGRSVRGIALAGWLTTTAGGFTTLAAALAKVTRFAGPLGALMAILTPSELGDSSMQSEEGQRIEDAFEENPDLLFDPAQNEMIGQSQEAIRRDLPTDNLEVLPQIDEGIRSLQEYLQQSSAPAGPTSDQAGGAPSVVNNTTANAQATFSIVVPPGSTAEQIAFIQAEIDRGLNRAAEQAARSLEA